jgi:signal transduction histidine kinase
LNFFARERTFVAPLQRSALKTIMLGEKPDDAIPMTASVSHAQVRQLSADAQTYFKDLLDDVNLHAVIVNPPGQVTYCNNYFIRLTGWSLEDLGAQCWHFDSDMLTRTGERRSIRWNSFVLRDTAGNAIAAAGIGEDVTEQKHVERALMDCSARERCSLERDLHDGLGQDLAGIALLAKSLATTAHRDRLAIAQDLARLSMIASNAIESCRRIAREFSPSSDLQGGLIHALRQLTSMPAAAGRPAIEFALCQTAPLALSADASDHVYRIVQLWLADTVKYSRADTIAVNVTLRPNELRVEILDDGREALNLRKSSEILQHRAALLQAQLRVEPRRSGGTRLALSVVQPA